MRRKENEVFKRDSQFRFKREFSGGFHAPSDGKYSLALEAKLKVLVQKRGRFVMVWSAELKTQRAAAAD